MQNKTKIAIGLGLATAGVGLWLLLTSSKGRAQSLDRLGADGSKSKDSRKSRQLLKTSKYAEMVNSLRRLVQNEVASGHISKRLAVEISRLVTILIKDEYLGALIRSRQLRRKVLSSLRDYAREFISATEESESIFEEGTSEVLKDLDIDEEFFESECERLRREDPEFELINLYLVESLKNLLPAAAVAPTLEGFVGFLSFQIDNFHTVNLQDISEIPLPMRLQVKEALLSDRAALKFGVEEEDFLRNPSVLNNPELIQKQRIYQEMVMNERQSLTSFPY